MKIWINRRVEMVENVLNRPREIPYINLSQKILNTQEGILKMGPKYTLEDSVNLKETIPRTKSVIEMLPENERQRIRNKYQEEFEKRMREYDKDREDRRVLEEMKQDMEIACLDSDKTGRIIIMDRGEYNFKMKEAIVKMDSESVNRDSNELLME